MLFTLIDPEQHWIREDHEEVRQNSGMESLQGVRHIQVEPYLFYVFNHPG